MLFQLLGNLSTKSLDVGELVSKFVDLGDVFLKRVSKLVVLLLAFLEDLEHGGNGPDGNRRVTLRKRGKYLVGWNEERKNERLTSLSSSF